MRYVSFVHTPDIIRNEVSILIVSQYNDNENPESFMYGKSMGWKYAYAQSINMFVSPTGGRLNKKDGLTRYGDSHVKDKTS